MKKQMGRPGIVKGETQEFLHCVRLSARLQKKVNRIGNGNISAGIRKAIESFKL
jgi:hypothetical protein